MSVTGIVLFVIFLLVKSLLDKKKKEARRQKVPESSASPDGMGGTAETTQVMVENPTEVRDFLRRFLDERAAAVETSDVPSEALSEIESASAARSPASLRHAENRGKKLQNSLEEAARPRALALDLAPAGLLQAVVLAEIIGRPKAQRRRSPYFRS
ncbi:hypothetical protein [Selenomonas sp. CM52]|uniref:hypothetical protein n=1 Tax=Selenomonas sp. CM52 TaxID=936381 RepID=UPI00027C4075|nr:hypothetical protein [Selenomonas sp. CM52]EJU25423.1 hypothetical protein HMPREF1153_0025 [Selenomonas sp. CM52]